MHGSYAVGNLFEHNVPLLTKIAIMECDFGIVLRCFRYRIERRSEIGGLEMAGNISHNRGGGGSSNTVTAKLFPHNFYLNGIFLFMRRLVFGLLFCALFLSFPVSRVFAENVRSDTEQRVQFITDQKSGTLSIQIEGELIAFFDKNGLHVVKNIEYGGVLTDVGAKNTVELFESLKNSGVVNEK